MYKRYFFRLDDIAPNMNWDKFNFIVSVFQRHNIKPLLAVIPDNKDPELLKYPVNSDFWRIIKELNQDGWTIAQHGFEHLYKIGNGGVLKIHKSGEFGSLDLELQKSKITSGKEIIKKELCETNIFVAPGHSFDKNTIKALKIKGFSYISDGIALYPFKKWGIIWLPQILWRPRKGLFGIITVALHLNTMSSEEIDKLEKFIKTNRDKIGNFSELMNWYPHAGVFRKFLAFFVNQPFRIFWRVIFKIKFLI